MKVSSDKGLKNLNIGQTPVIHVFEFGIDPAQPPSIYNLDFSAKGYETKTITIKRDSIKDPMNISLDPEVVREIKRFVPVISADKGYTLERRIVRSWVEDIEREGMAASIVVRLEENQSIIGMTLSPDGKTLYFSLAEPVIDEKGKDKNMANLRSVQTSGGGITQVTSGQWLDANPACSHDSNYLVFSSNRLQTDKPDIFRISTEKTSGIAVIQQTSEGANYQPSIAKNGTIAFTFMPKYQNKIIGTEQIWTIGGDNNYPTQLKAGNMAAISPDGKEIAFIGDNEIYLMNKDGTNQINLTNNSASDQLPVWSPNGEKIAFVSDRDSNDEIYLINSDSTNLKRLTNNSSSDGGWISFSPDGQKIAFESDRDGNIEIYVIDITGENEINITNNNANDTFPNWTILQNKIFFCSNRDGNNQQIYIMDLDGNNVTNISNNQMENFLPSYSPITEKGGGCFITKILNHNHISNIINTLTKFRDNYLFDNFLSKSFVSYY